MNNTMDMSQYTDYNPFALEKSHRQLQQLQIAGREELLKELYAIRILDDIEESLTASLFTYFAKIVHSLYEQK